MGRRRKHISGRCGGGGAVKLSGMPSAALIHFDARDLVSGSNYDPGTTRVSSWPSRNGSVTVAQTTAASQPLYQAAGFGASPGVLFDGSDDILWSAYSGLNTQTISMIVGIRYTGGATNYHQASLGGSALGAGESNADNYYNGFGIRPYIGGGGANNGFTALQGPPSGGYNQRSQSPVTSGLSLEPLTLGASWAYVGSTNVVCLSRAGSTTGISVTNDLNLSGTFQSISLGKYANGVLEGQITEARAWNRTLSQVELNRATLIMNGRLA